MSQFSKKERWFLVFYVGIIPMGFVIFVTALLLLLSPWKP